MLPHEEHWIIVCHDGAEHEYRASVFTWIDVSFNRSHNTVFVKKSLFGFFSHTVPYPGFRRIFRNGCPLGIRGLKKTQPANGNTNDVND